MIECIIEIHLVTSGIQQVVGTYAQPTFIAIRSGNHLKNLNHLLLQMLQDKVHLTELNKEFHH